ncbi:glycosyltransferase family 2 protein [bacterium]|nr:glycosyltransferase family 2 protein [bacterium]
MVKISVIVPVYNTEKYIERCLDSLVNQTLKELEIICVDDGSDDKSLDILNSYAQKYSNIKVLTQNHKKQGAARNLGFTYAQGEYIGYVDSDDWVDENYYEKLYNSAQKYNCDVALATNVRIGSGKTKKRLNIEQEKYVTSLQEKLDINNQYKNACPTNKIYRKSLLETHEILFPEDMYCEDKIFTLKALYYADGVVTVPDIYYYYFRNSDSTVKSSKFKKSMKFDENKARLDMLNFLSDNNADIRDKDFWAVSDSIKCFGLLLLQIKKSLKTKRYYLFGIIPIWEKSL